MNRLVLGALATLVLVSIGLFWMQGRAEVEEGAPPPELVDAMEAEMAAQKAELEPLPEADVTDLVGPEPPEATELTREQRRFGRYDRNSDGRITRHEMMATRTAGFRALDKDGNNLLTFEEWAVATGDKFSKADADGDLSLTPQEFATTKPRSKTKPKCKC